MHPPTDTPKRFRPQFVVERGAGPDAPASFVSLWPPELRSADLIRLRIQQNVEEAETRDAWHEGFQSGWAQGVAFERSRRPIVEQLPPTPLYRLAFRALTWVAKAAKLYARAEMKRLAKARYLNRRLGPARGLKRISK